MHVPEREYHRRNQECVGRAYGTVLLSERAAAAFGAMRTDAGYFLDAATRCKLFICECEIDALALERSEFTRFRSGVKDVLRHDLRATRWRAWTWSGSSTAARRCSCPTASWPGPRPAA